MDKFLARSGWYDTSEKDTMSWRSKLSVEWKGTKPIQRRVPDMKFTTVLQVPSSYNGRLVKELARVEPRLAKSSGVQ